MGELYCRAYTQMFGLPTVCLRYFNIYGPRQDPNGEYAAVIAKFTQRMKAGQPPIIYGDGSQTRDFVHVSDVVRANLLACEDERAIGEVFNIAAGQGVSLLDLVDTLNQLSNAQIHPQFAGPRIGDIKHSQGNAARLAAALNFRPGISLAEGLSSVVTNSLA